MNKEESIQKIQDQIDKVKEYLEYGMPYSEYLDLQLAFDDIVNLIQKQEAIIDKMAEKINQAYFDKENMYIWFEEKILPKDEFGLCEYKDLGTRKTRIKEYFKKVVDEDVKD